MDKFEIENQFYYTCDLQRIEKLIFLYNALENIKDIPGDIIECGVFKGISLIRLASLRDILKIDKKIYGFDTFDRYPDAEEEKDIIHREKFVREAGEYSIKIEELYKILSNKKLDNIYLVKGDVMDTIDLYKNLRISLLILDVDLYKPTKHILEVFWNRILPGGIIILDNYNSFDGETKAVEEFFENKDITIYKYLNKYFIRK